MYLALGLLLLIIADSESKGNFSNGTLLTLTTCSYSNIGIECGDWATVEIHSLAYGYREGCEHLCCNESDSESDCIVYQDKFESQSLQRECMDKMRCNITIDGNNMSCSTHTVQASYVTVNYVCTQTCGPVPKIENGNVEIESKNHTTAILICNHGYHPRRLKIACIESTWQHATCTRLATGTKSQVRIILLATLTGSMFAVVVVGALIIFVVRKKRRTRQCNAGPNLPELRQSEGRQLPKDLIKIRISNWEDWLHSTNETDRVDEANNLLKMHMLPNQSQLEKACIRLRKNSDTFLAICKEISEQIKRESCEIIDVWTAYRCSDYNTSGEIKIVFCVLTKKGNVGVSVSDYELYERGDSEISEESEDVLRAVEIAQKQEDKFKETDIVALEHCVSENADSLMKNHKNLSIISPSLKKSTGYGKENAIINDQMCISLYVHIKGLVPIAEEPFPTKIGTFATDVLEDRFKPFQGGPYAYHEQLKMGLAIRANFRNNHVEFLSGTLGGFIDHANHGLCGLTCAHVVLSGDEMLQLKAKGCLNFFEYDKKVFQPVDQSAKPFGQVISAFYSEGGNGSSGMEVALLKIVDRLPTNGSFPEAENYEAAGFDDSNPMVYNTGKVCETAKIRRRAEVYKYGISTEVTRGSLGFRGSVVRTTEMSGKCETFDYHLYNQIEVLRIDGKCFALPGDSGALVFFDDCFDHSVAIGIVEGGQINGKVFVTPICDILNTFECPFTMKNFLSVMSTSMDDSGVSADIMDWES